jgi:hypothetical protein
MPPLPILDLMIYGEYLYNTRLFGRRLDVNTINFGVLVGI